MNKFTLGLFLCLFTLTNMLDANAKVSSQPLPHTFYLNIPVQGPSSNWQLSAKYQLPRSESSNPRSAVIIVHSTSGIDSTGQYYAKALNKAGIATLEVDLWGARNLMGGSDNRPSSPQETLPDIFAALHYLAQRAEIDANNIGIIGFSWGGVLSMLTATEQYMALTGTPLRFAAHVAHYPVCWLYNNVPGFEFSNLTGAPVLIQSGNLDDYDTPETCPMLVSNLATTDAQTVSLNMFKHAYHAWDRLEPKWLVTDPYSHLGQGGEVLLAPNKRIARKSKRNVVEFFSAAFNHNDVDED